MAKEPWPISLEQLAQAVKLKSYQNESRGIPVIAVPTTAGSGADLTMWGTLWDIGASQKYSVEATWLFPVEAWIVPELTATMPPRLTLSTGLDALCHAAEAWWSTRSNAIVRQLAGNAIMLITTALPQALRQPNDLNARACMCRGALFAALAFSNTRTTACHGLSYPLTLRFGMPHGFAAAITLYEVLRLNGPQIPDKEQLLKAFGVDSTEQVGQWLDNLCAPVQPLRLSAFGVGADEARKALLGSDLVRERMGNNPVVLTSGDIARIIDAIR
jgi:alcohol dehydrogenase class IV